MPDANYPSADAVHPPLGALERIRDPGIVPLEIGDLLVDGGVIRDRMQEDGFVPGLRRALQILRAGDGATRSNGRLPAIVEGFDAVFFCGGRASKDTLGALSGGAPCELFLADAAVFAGLRAGFLLLQQRGYSGWVMDLGQSQLKLASSGRVITAPRDVGRLRARGDVADFELPAQRRRLREFISLQLQRLRTEEPVPPEALLAALPARLGSDGRPARSDYAGLGGYRHLIPDAIALAGLSNVPAFVINDAELAGFSARADPRLAAFRKILVLTLGFGIGAALVIRSG